MRRSKIERAVDLLWTIQRCPGYSFSRVCAITGINQRLGKQLAEKLVESSLIILDMKRTSDFRGKYVRGSFSLTAEGLKVLHEWKEIKQKLIGE